MTIKVLPLENWQKSQRYLDEREKGYYANHKEITPIMNKDGYYLKGGYCWFEYNGRAFEYDASSFEYKYSIYNKPCYTQNELSILQQVPKKYINKLGENVLVADDFNKKDLSFRLNMFKRRKQIAQRMAKGMADIVK